MGELASMEHVQPNWVRLYYAPLVLRRTEGGSRLAVRHLIDDMVSRYAAHNCCSCCVTDTAIEVSFFAAKTGEILTASAHPTVFGERYLYPNLVDPPGPIPRDILHGVVHDVGEIANRLYDDFQEMCRTGALVVVARPDSPREKFSVVAPDTFGHFEIEDWELVPRNPPTARVCTRYTPTDPLARWTCSR
jgi:hypothetical protein